MRAFLGIALPASLRQLLVEVQRTLAEAGTDVRWVQPECLHVTLRFLGEINEVQRIAIERIGARIGSSQGPFQLGLGSVGAFPTLDAPRVIWMGIDQGRDVVTQLMEHIEKKLRQVLAPSQEEHAFIPHVTLGRVRSPRSSRILSRHLQTVPWRVPPPWSVSALTLFQSVLSSAGPRYTVFSEFSLEDSSRAETV